MTAKKWKRLTGPETDEWMSQMWSIHIWTEYYSARKRNEILIEATMWMKPENILLGEISQTQETMNDSICRKCVQNRHTNRAECRLVVPGGCGGWEASALWGW